MKCLNESWSQLEVPILRPTLDPVSVSVTRYETCVSSAWDSRRSSGSPGAPHPHSTTTCNQKQNYPHPGPVSISVLAITPRVRMNVVDNPKRRDVISAAIIESDKKIRSDIQFILDLGILKIVPKSTPEGWRILHHTIHRFSSQHMILINVLSVSSSQDVDFCDTFILEFRN